FGINVDILSFSFQCSILLPQELIILAINFKVNNFFNFPYELATKKDLSVKVVAWQRPTLAERKSNYHRR
ncbi:hypothetical protein, partial [Staphylococcus haemolyticus]|uniref:hypothetical protein n=1 Tax=Staphylococcus haemolyticus TaxID=1283 RepID=UPI0030BD0464